MIASNELSIGGSMIFQTGEQTPKVPIILANFPPKLHENDKKLT